MSDNSSYNTEVECDTHPVGRGCTEYIYIEAVPDTELVTENDFRNSIDVYSKEELIELCESQYNTLLSYKTDVERLQNTINTLTHKIEDLQNLNQKLLTQEAVNKVFKNLQLKKRENRPKRKYGKLTRRDK